MNWTDVHAVQPSRVKSALLVFILALLLIPFAGLTFKVDTAYASGPVFPLKASANGRYLTDQNNVPFLINADTAWLALDKLSTSDYDTYLDDRLAKSFNTIMVMAPVSYNTNNYYGEAPFTTEGDLTTPNNNWWNRLDTFVGKAKDRGMVVDIVPLWLGYTGQQWWVKLDPVANINTEAECYAFGQFLANRYNDTNYPNVIWTLGGDKNPGDRYSRLNQIGLGIDSVTPNRPISAHARENQSSMDQYGSATWLNFNATYTYFPTWNNDRHVYVLSKIDYNRSPAKPFFLIESGYEYPEGQMVWPYLVRRQAYWSILSGSTGTTYGNYYVWDFKTGWQTAMGHAGAYDMQYMYNAFNSRAWYNLVPDFNHSVVTAGYGTYDDTPNADPPGNGNDYVTTARTSDGTLIMSYLPSTGTNARTLTVDMTKLSIGTVEAKWYNPNTGAYTSIGTYGNTNTAQTFTTPGNNGENTNDWLLILEQPSGSGAFVRGINFNGNAVTIEGNTWMSHTNALSNGLSMTAVTNASTSLTPSPATDSDTSAMLNKGVYSNNGFTATQTLTNGNYQVYIWIMENYSNNARRMNIKMEGVQVASNIAELPLNSWVKYGPYPVTVNDGALDVQFLKASGIEPHVMGMAVYHGVSDEFTADTLSPQWSWVREDNTKWSLTAATDKMRITSQYGDLYLATNAKNLLLENAPPGDWTAITKMDFGKPTTNYQQAGIIVYQNDDNYIKLLRVFNGSNKFQFAMEYGGVATQGTVADSISGSTVYMKMVKSGTTYSGYYSADGTNYTQIWTSQSANFSGIKIGMISVNGTVTAGGVHADFDYFRVN